MTQEIRIPDIGDAEAVEVVEICVAVGDRVGPNDALIVIESDKASMEVPAGAEGVIEAITVAVGDEVSEGQVIARLSGARGDDGAEDSAGAPAGDEGTGARKQATDGEPASPRPDTERTETVDDAAAAKSGDGAGSAQPPSGAGARASLEIRVPDIGEAQNVVVIEVAVTAGDAVTASDLLVVVESDKASMEIPAGHDGVVQTVHVGEGDEVEEGTLLVTLETEGAAAPAGETSSPKAAQPAAEPVAEPAAESESAPDSEAESGPESGRAVAPPGEVSAEPAAGAEVYAGPAVRRLARELGVDLKQVSGSGSRGRIVKEDVKAFVKSRLGGAGVAGGAAGAGAGLPGITLPDFSRFGETEVVPMSRIRVRGAENLHRSWINLPHVTQHDEVDVTDLEDFRNSLKGEAESRGVKLTPLAFIIKACCHALEAFPTVNSSLDMANGNYVVKRYYNIGMAVDTDEGLVVPVIRDADRKGIWELSEEIIDLAGRARKQKLGMNDMQGGSFSVSSLGAVGGTGFTPIINPPEVAILGISRLATKPVWNGSSFEPRKMLPLSLSYDHRALNGAEAARFVAYLGDLLSDIRRLAL